jgi:signal peptidase I
MGKSTHHHQLVADTDAVDDAPRETPSPPPVENSGPGARRPFLRRVRRVVSVLWRAVFTITLISVCLVGALVAYGSVTGKFRVTTMLTGSMSNVLPVGSLVVVQPHPAQELEVDDIIAFVPPEAEDTTIHRVIEILEWDPQPVVTTKGDMNNAVDPWVPMRIEQAEVWKPTFMIPRVGEALLWLQDTGNRLKAAGAVAAVLWLRLMWGIWRGGDDDEEVEVDEPSVADGDGDGDGDEEAGAAHVGEEVEAASSTSVVPAGLASPEASRPVPAEDETTS